MPSLEALRSKLAHFGVSVDSAAVAQAHVRSLPRDALVACQGEAVEGLGVLLDGELSRWRDGRLLDFVESPEMVGVGEAVRGGPSQLTVRAARPSRIAWLPAEAISDEARVDYLAERPAVAELEAARHVQSLDDFWVSPNARLTPGPYAFGPFTAALLVIEGPPGHVKKLLPPGLHPVPGLGDRYLLVLADLRDARCESEGAFVHAMIRYAASPGEPSPTTGFRCARAP